MDRRRIEVPDFDTLDLSALGGDRLLIFGQLGRNANSEQRQGAFRVRPTPEMCLSCATPRPVSLKIH